MRTLASGAAHKKTRARAAGNLYVASIVAVNVNTGELKWRRWFRDQWDYDSVQQMTLADSVSGRTRKVIAGEQDGFLCADHRASSFRPAFSRVSWAKGDRSRRWPIINPEVMPEGSHRYRPAAAARLVAVSFNPQTGLVCIPTRGWDTFNYAVHDLSPTSRVGAATGLNKHGWTDTKPPAGHWPRAAGRRQRQHTGRRDPVKQEIRWRCRSATASLRHVEHGQQSGVQVALMGG
jgi:hypothetical protein